MHIAAAARDRADLAARARRTCTRAREEGEGVREHRQDRPHAPQDATPLTLGQEFSGYAAQVERGIARMRHGG